MIRNIIRTAAAYIANTAYEDGRRDGAGLVPRRELERERDLKEGAWKCYGVAMAARDKALAERDEARAELEAVKADRDRILRELGANLGNAPEPGEIKRRVSELYAERDEARRNEARMSNLRDDTIVHCRKELDKLYEWRARAEKAEAALKSQPAAFPWSDEAVERAAKAHWDWFGGPGGPSWENAGESRRKDVMAMIRNVLATLAPPPQAAPVPPVGVGDVWGDAVRVTKDDADYVVMVGRCIVDRYTSGGYANAVAEDIRRGLASLPPLRAVLVGGVTEGMVEAFDDAKELVSRPLTGTPGDATRAGLTAALAAANIRVLGPGEGVVRVRVAKSAMNGCEDVGSCVHRTRDSWTAVTSDVCWLNAGTPYILAADLDAIAGRVGT